MLKSKKIKDFLNFLFDMKPEIKSLHHFHVFFKISGGIKNRAQTTSFILVIYESQNDGHVTFHSYLIKSFFPLLYPFSGSLGSYYKKK